MYVSVALWLTAECPFNDEAIGAKVFGPANAMKTAAVDLAMLFPAKAGSVKRNNRQSDMGSPMCLIRFMSNADVVVAYHTGQPHVARPRPTQDLFSDTMDGWSKSNLNMRAAYNIPMTTSAAMPLK